MKALVELVLRILGALFGPKNTGQLHAAHAGPPMLEPALEVPAPAWRAAEIAQEPPVPTPAPRLPLIEIDETGVMHGDGVSLIPTARTQGLATPDGEVEGIVWHWTDTRGVGAVQLARRIVNAPAPGEHVGSCHAWIGAGGAIAQSTETDRGSWHAGIGYTFQRGDDGIYKIAPGRSINSYFFGVEIECVGDVRLVGGKWLGWPFAFGTKWGTPAVVPADEVKVHPRIPSRGWHMFTDAQVEAATRITSVLVRRFDLKRANCAWGHLQIDPANRTDPGPLWMGSVGGDGFTVPKIGTAPDGHLHKILDEVFGAA